MQNFLKCLLNEVVGFLEGSMFIDNAFLPNIYYANSLHIVYACFFLSNTSSFKQQHAEIGEKLSKS